MYYVQCVDKMLAMHRHAAHRQHDNRNATLSDILTICTAAELTGNADPICWLRPMAKIG